MEPWTCSESLSSKDAAVDYSEQTRDCLLFCYYSQGYKLGSGGEGCPRDPKASSLGTLNCESYIADDSAVKVGRAPNEVFRRD